MRVLKDVYLTFSRQRGLKFSCYAGETGKGIRIHIGETTEGKEFKNFIKIKEKLYETKVTNITENTFDVVFPSLEAGTYLGEIQIHDNGERVKSGIYRIEVGESLTSEEAEKMEAIDSDSILERLSDAEREVQKKIKLLDSAIEGKGGLSAYHVWLNNGNQGTEEDFLESLKGETPKLNFILDNNGNLFVDIN